MSYLENVQRLILESGLKRKFLAEKLEIRYDTFRLKLNGTNDFKVQELINLCKILNKNIMEVFENENG